MCSESDGSYVGPTDPLNQANQETAVRQPAAPRRWSWFSFVTGILATSLVFTFVGSVKRPLAVAPSSPTSKTPNGDLPTDAQAAPSSMEEVLQIAEDVTLHMRQYLDDYTALLVKQETIGGVLTEPAELAIKVMCTHRGGKMDESEPMRVYLRFVSPPTIAGREVIWGENLHDGKLVVHEAGLMGLVTLQLDPTGMIAMRGQRYPIYEIGLTKLVQKLIERGGADRNNPDISVTIKRDLQLDGHNVDLITVLRRRPSGKEDDFSRAEICFDTQRKLPLRYTAYGWGSDANKPPLIESYTYKDVRTNVGLSEADFDPQNPDYQFP